MNASNQQDPWDRAAAERATFDDMVRQAKLSEPKAPESKVLTLLMGVAVVQLFGGALIGLGVWWATDDTRVIGLAFVIGGILLCVVIITDLIRRATWPQRQARKQQGRTGSPS